MYFISATTTTTTHAIGEYVATVKDAHRAEMERQHASHEQVPQLSTSEQTHTHTFLFDVSASNTTTISSAAASAVLSSSSDADDDDDDNCDGM